MGNLGIAPFFEQALHPYEGVRVIRVPGGELGRGRGGPRCMSCPTVREDL